MALAFGSFSETVRITAIDLGWIQQTDTTERAPLVARTVGLVGFGLAFGSVWVQERAVIADEVAMFMSRRNAVWAFVATYMAAVVMAAVPAVADLPGRAVALAIVAMATAALVVGVTSQGGHDAPRQRSSAGRTHQSTATVPGAGRPNPG